ncbi:hypothetical protein ACP70R_040927 [Stipagrostis hirtigluma subsp. patula]
MSTLTFAVCRHDPTLIELAAPTPRETKRLSDVDDHETLRRQVPFLFFYRGRVHPGAQDPAAVIRRALGEALVLYYPLAGRLREVEGRKLVVDCTGEGVMFVEADADVPLAELETAGLRPPLPCMDQLLFDVEGSSGVLNSPLLLIQVTRLLCGGFVFALRLNHAICDAIGLAQFMSAVAELARGVPAPTVTPACHADLHLRPGRRRGDQGAPPAPHLRETATTFEALTAALWRARTAALELPPEDEVRLVFMVNIRGVRALELPAGYYGNAIVTSVALTTAAALLAGSLGDAVELVREAKAAVTAEYVRSTADLLVLRGRPVIAIPASLYFVSDNRHAGFHRLDFGWGVPVYGGLSSVVFGGSYLVAVRNGNGELAVAVPIVLPQPAMDRFVSEVEVMLTTLVGSVPR